MARKVLIVPCSPNDCWRGFTDAESLCAWVPGLRSATVVAKHADGMPAEIQFEFARSRSYSLAYSYAATGIAKIVRWEPRSNEGDAVRGFARFELCEGGTQITYELEHGDSRTERERYLGSAEELLDAFAHWIAERELRDWSLDP